MSDRPRTIADVADEVLAVSIARASTTCTDPDAVVPFVDQVLVAALAKWRTHLEKIGEHPSAGKPLT